MAKDPVPRNEPIPPLKPLFWIELVVGQVGNLRADWQSEAAWRGHPAWRLLRSFARLVSIGNLRAPSVCSRNIIRVEGV